jgi:hypothetical protein
VYGVELFLNRSALEVVRNLQADTTLFVGLRQAESIGEIREVFGADDLEVRSGGSKLPNDLQQSLGWREGLPGVEQTSEIAVRSNDEARP